ncbi:hypothetical protein ACN73_15415 [Escherichia coli]|nr:hypothetical protein ACN73_15415 [Escherichia coli]
MVRRLRFSGPKTSIICSPMTSLKTSIKTITYLSDTGCLEIQGASLCSFNNECWKFCLSIKLLAKLFLCFFFLLR